MDKTLIRLIDNFSTENVIKSPFKDLVSQFNAVEHKLQWTIIPEISTKSETTWAAPTHYRVLSRPSMNPNKYIKLIYKNKPIKSMSQKGDLKKNWYFVSTKETLNLKKSPQFSRELNGIPVTSKKSFKFDKLLPAGMVSFTISLANPNWRKYKHKIKLLINGQESSFSPLPHKQNFWVRHQVDTTALYSIEIVFLGGINAKIGRNKLILKKLHISPPVDLILRSTEPSDRFKTQNLDYRVQYFTSEPLPALKKPAIAKEINDLFLYQTRYLTGYESVGDSPYSLIKIFHIGEFNKRTIISPSGSQYRFTVPIPENGFLQLGFGFHIINAKKLIDEETETGH